MKTKRKKLKEANLLIADLRADMNKLEQQVWLYKSNGKALRLLEQQLAIIQKEQHWVFLSIKEPSKLEKEKQIRKVEIFNTKTKKKRILTFYISIETERRAFEQIHREYRALEKIKENSNIQLFCDSVLKDAGYL